MAYLFDILIFVITISFLVLVHEYGHYLAACIFKVRVLRFSIGFGKPFYKHINKKNKTEFCLSPILIGGYVKMLDSRETQVKLEDIPFAFDHKPILQRAAIIFAGPLANILFALFAFWMMFVIGVKIPKPIIGKIVPNSIASTAKMQAGEEITKIDNLATKTWQEVLIGMLFHVGNKDTIKIKTQISPLAPSKTYALDLTNWQLNPLKPDPLESIGIEPYHPILPPIIGEVEKDSPAWLAGLKKNDKVISINNVKIFSWDDVIQNISDLPDKTLAIEILRQGEIKKISAVTTWKFGSGWKKIGFLGIQSLPVKWPEQALMERKFNLFNAILPTLQESYIFSALNIVVLSKLISGKLPLKILGGPISIFQASMQASKQGLVLFIGFLALISLTLALVNLIPFPGLDGGYFIFLLIEGIFRIKISIEIQSLIIKIGMLALIILFLQVSINDVIRIFS